MVGIVQSDFNLIWSYSFVLRGPFFSYLVGFGCCGGFSQGVSRDGFGVHVRRFQLAWFSISFGGFRGDFSRFGGY